MHLFLYVISYMKWLRKILSMDFPQSYSKACSLERYTALEADVSSGEKTVIEETQEMDAWLIWPLLCFTKWPPGLSEHPMQ